MRNNSSRHSTRVTNYTQNIKEGTVDSSTFLMEDINSSNEIETVIQLPEYLYESTKYKVTPIIGSMDRDGWEVYRGVNFKLSHVKRVENELNILTTKHEHHFKGVNNTNRKMLNIDSLECILNKQIRSYKHIHSTFNELQKELLWKVPYLDEVVTNGKSVLCNMGKVDEQMPHRDYSSTKK